MKNIDNNDRRDSLLRGIRPFRFPLPLTLPFVIFLLKTFTSKIRVRLFRRRQRITT